MITRAWVASVGVRPERRKMVASKAIKANCSRTHHLRVCKGNTTSTDLRWYRTTTLNYEEEDMFKAFDEAQAKSMVKKPRSDGGEWRLKELKTATFGSEFETTFNKKEELPPIPKTKAPAEPSAEPKKRRRKTYAEIVAEEDERLRIAHESPDKPELDEDLRAQYDMIQQEYRDSLKPKPKSKKPGDALKRPEITPRHEIQEEELI